MQMHLSGHEIDDRGGVPLIGNMVGLDAGHHVEQFAGHVDRAASAGNRSYSVAVLLSASVDSDRRIDTDFLAGTFCCFPILLHMHGIARGVTLP
ncbi:MAG: hypothetical protein ACXWI9_25720 [Burkholderiales bacterium]